MQTKLTLRMDDELIGRAKAYAHRSGKSVSRVVADFFALLDAPEHGGPVADLTPTVQSLLGALGDADLDEDDYRDHVVAKHE